MYKANDRTRQVEAIKRLAADIAGGYLVDPADFGGNVGAAACEAVEYYVDELNTVMPEWLDATTAGYWCGLSQRR